jgi:hypothetical protein
MAEPNKGGIMTTQVQVTVAEKQVRVVTSDGSTDIVLDTRGDTTTFWVPQGVKLGVEETADASISPINKINTGGSISEVSEDTLKGLTS